jgi:hypothetical protein
LLLPKNYIGNPYLHHIPVLNIRSILYKPEEDRGDLFVVNYNEEKTSEIFYTSSFPKERNALAAHLLEKLITSLKYQIETAIVLNDEICDPLKTFVFRQDVEDVTYNDIVTHLSVLIKGFEIPQDREAHDINYVKGAIIKSLNEIEKVLKCLRNEYVSLINYLFEECWYFGNLHNANNCPRTLCINGLNIDGFYIIDKMQTNLRWLTKFPVFKKISYGFKIESNTNDNDGYNVISLQKTQGTKPMIFKYYWKNNVERDIYLNFILQLELNNNNSSKDHRRANLNFRFKTESYKFLNNRLVELQGEQNYEEAVAQLIALSRNVKELPVLERIYSRN